MVLRATASRGGYEDAGFFSRLFRRKVSLSSAHRRKRFGAPRCPAQRVVSNRNGGYKLSPHRAFGYWVTELEEPVKSIAIVAAAVLLMVGGKAASFSALPPSPAVAAAAGAETAPGQMKGGVNYSLPPWFKSSFLHFKDDIEEARQQGRHVMVFLHLEQCPYCARMLKENFESGDTRDFMQKHFDVIGINIRGGRK
jgi:hypothetical protein